MFVFIFPRNVRFSRKKTSLFISSKFKLNYFHIHPKADIIKGDIFSLLGINIYEYMINCQCLLRNIHTFAASTDKLLLHKRTKVFSSFSLNFV